MFSTSVADLSVLLLLATLNSNESVGREPRLKRSRFYFLDKLASEGKTLEDQRKSEEARKVKAMALCMNHGLDARQQKLCAKLPFHVLAAFRGFREAVDECQYQFRHARWNCSSLVNLRRRSTPPLLTPMMKRGFKEVAFVHALVAAAVAKSVSLDCARGSINPCEKLGSKRRRSKESFRNYDTAIQHGLYFSEKFLNSRTSSYDLMGILNRHNLRTGRIVFVNNLKILCKCHGVSGSCTVKSCVKMAPGLRVLGRSLKKMYEKAKKIEPVNEQRRGVRLQTPDGEKPVTKHDLIYMEDSPTFCDRDVSLGTRGVKGRLCSLDPTHKNSCRVLCCGRGYDTLRLKADAQCQCTFRWCCYVECKKCRREKWVTVCK